MMKAFRRSVTASRDIKPNIPIGIGDIKYVRPGHGLEPKEVGLLLGKKFDYLIKKDHVFSHECLSNCQQ